MKTFGQWLENVDTPFVYHATRKEKVAEIMRDGLRSMQTSNWVAQGDKTRMGEGEVHVFEDEGDAVRWGFKMDWEFYKGKMAGDIVILKIRNTGGWEPDNKSPMEQAGAFGKWLKRYKAVPAEDIVNVETLTPEMVKATVQRSNKAYEN